MNWKLFVYKNFLTDRFYSTGCEMIGGMVVLWLGMWLFRMELWQAVRAYVRTYCCGRTPVA